MKLNNFKLAATTDNLKNESKVRDVADVLEFRMDKAKKPIEQLCDYDGKLNIIATNRGQWFGGQASDEGRLDRLFVASEFDYVNMVDIELEFVRGNDWVTPEFRNNDVEIIISYHAFQDTPDKKTLDAIFNQCDRYGDISKVATLAENTDDTVRMVNAIHDANSDGKNVAGISMGEIGRSTRVVAPYYGSQLGYAPLKYDKCNYAPGQISIHKLASMIETFNFRNTLLEELNAIQSKNSENAGVINNQ
jgi:3-dehydroquinate dehydratase-1